MKKTDKKNKKSKRKKTEASKVSSGGAVASSLQGSHSKKQEKKQKHATVEKKSKSAPGQKRKRRDDNLRPHVLISGYYGFDNLGDELILNVLVSELKARDVDITVLSQNPTKTASQYGVKAIKRTSVLDIIDALATANLFISGGGGLFQDATGPKSCIYYGGLIQLADFFEVPVVFWSQGVGPIRGKSARWFTAKAINTCEQVVVRDAKSAELVEALTGMRPEVTADPVWLFQPPKLSRKRSQPLTLGEKQKPADKYNKAAHQEPWCIGISLRPWPELNKERLEALAACLNAFALQVDRPVAFKLLPFQAKEDTHLLSQFQALLKPSQQITVEMVEPLVVMNKMAECDLIVGMRFHSLILGLLYNIPVYGLIYDPKVESLLSYFKLKGTSIAGLKDISPDWLREYLLNYPEIDLAPLKKEAQRNIQVLENLLDMPATVLIP